MSQNKDVYITANVKGAGGLVVLGFHSSQVFSAIVEMETAKLVAAHQNLNWDDMVLQSSTTFIQQWADRATTFGKLGESDLEGVPVRWLQNSLIWLVHCAGKTSEMLARSETDTAVLSISPGTGMRGVNVDFLPVSELIRSAANDNEHR